jgi:hypothetical protein
MCGGEKRARFWVTRGIGGVDCLVSGIVWFLAHDSFVVMGDMAQREKCMLWVSKKSLS